MKTSDLRALIGEAKFDEAMAKMKNSESSRLEDTELMHQLVRRPSIIKGKMTLEDGRRALRQAVARARNSSE